MDNKLLDPDLVKLIKYYGTIGIDLSVTVLGGFFLGWLIDKTLRTQPIFTLLLFVMGCYGGFASVYSLVSQRIKREEEQEEQKEREEDD